MHVQTAPLPDFRDAAPRGLQREAPARQTPAAERDEADALDPVLSAALLVASAFRLRDEGGLIATLRLLANAVAAWESQQALDGAAA